MGVYDKRFAKFAKTSLLIIDDYGLYPMGAPQDEDFHELNLNRPSGKNISAS
jgi:DNA replication protein DnaC